MGCLYIAKSRTERKSEKEHPNFDAFGEVSKNEALENSYRVKQKVKCLKLTSPLTAETDCRLPAVFGCLNVCQRKWK